MGNLRSLYAGIKIEILKNKKYDLTFFGFGDELGGSKLQKKAIYLKHIIRYTIF